MSTTFLVSLIAIVPVIFLLKRLFDSHPFDKIPGPRPSSWWLGSIPDVFAVDGRSFYTRLSEEYPSTLSFKGLFGIPMLYSYDPKVMHQVMVKEHATVFEENPVILQSIKFMFGGGLLSVDGEHHRKQRKMLTPVFSTAHMREMVPIFYEVTHRLESALVAKVQSGPQEIDMLSWMTRTALELVGQSGLGYSFDSLKDEETAHPYSIAIKRLAPLLEGNRHWFMLLSTWLTKYGTPTVRKIGAWAFSLFSSDFREGKDLTEYMWALSKQIFEDKKTNGTNGLGERLAGKDIISILMKENAKALDEDRLTDDEVIAQMSTLIFAGMDTTSSALSRVLHLLAAHPDVQSKLREEIMDASGDGDIPYDTLVSLPYLDAIARESLRLYPPVYLLQRRAYKDTTVSLSTPITSTDGSTLSEVFIPRNSEVVINVFNSNRNRMLWGADADEWKPERWLSPLPPTLTDAKIPGVYSHLMTFNSGGRSCIGFKFSQLEMKLVLSLLIRRFEFSQSDKEIQWETAFVARPVSKDNKPLLPLMVRLLKEEM